MNKIEEKNIETNLLKKLDKYSNNIMFINYNKKIEKIRQYLLYILVFLLSFQTRLFLKQGELNGGYFEYGSSSLYIVDILIIILVLSFFNGFILNRSKSLIVKDYWKNILILELIIFISIFFTIDKYVAFYGYLKFLLGLGLFYLMVNVKYGKTRLVVSFLAGSFLHAILGIWQFMFQSSFSNKWLGLASHEASLPGSSVIEVMNDGRWLRAYGGLDHPNILAGFMMLSLFLIIYLMQRDLKRKKAGLPFFNIYFLYLLFFVYYISLFFTFSRAGWISFSTGMAVMLFVSLYKRELIFQKLILNLILTISILSFCLFYFYGDIVSTRIEGAARLEVKSNTERIESYQIAKEIIKNDWLFGVGIGNYTLAVERDVIDGQPSYFYQPVHNVFVLVWAEIGIIGLLLYLGIIQKVFASTLKEWKGNGSAIINIGIFISLFVLLFFDHWLWSLHFGILFFWFILGLLYKFTEN